MLCVPSESEMCIASQGLLPEYAKQGDRIQLFSATCGHTNQGLRCSLHAAPSTHDVLSNEGRLSMTFLRKRSPAYADAVEQGIVWEVIPWQVEIMMLFQDGVCAPL